MLTEAVHRDSAPTGASVLSMLGIEKSFGGVHALRGASIDVRAGEEIGRAHV